MVREPIAEHRLDVFFHLVPDLGVGVALAQILRLLLDLLHLSLDVVLFPVVADDAFQGIGVLDPLNQARVSAQRHDRVGAELEVPGPCLGIVLEHLVAQSGKVNEPLLFAQITVFVALEQEVVNVLVRAQDANLFWLLFAKHDCHFLQEARYHDWVLLESRE